MNSLLIVIAVSVLAVSVFLQQKNEKNVVESKDEGEVSGQTTSTTPTDTVTPTPENSATNTPTQTNSPTGQSTPTQSQTNQESIDTYIYPAATVTSKSSTSVTLESTDSTDSITNWYKEKIKAQGMNTKSFVQTATNGNIHNELAGAGNGGKISVSIKKNSDQSVVRIDVSL